jgi:flagellar basal body rod protein FlgC
MDRMTGKVWQSLSWQILTFDPEHNEMAQRGFVVSGAVVLRTELESLSSGDRSQEANLGCLIWWS